VLRFDNRVINEVSVCCVCIPSSQTGLHNNYNNSNVAPFPSYGRMYPCIFNNFYVIGPKATEFGEITQTIWPLRRSRSFKVTDFGTKRLIVG